MAAVKDKASINIITSKTLVNINPKLGDGHLNSKCVHQRPKLLFLEPYSGCVEEICYVTKRIKFCFNKHSSCRYWKNLWDEVINNCEIFLDLLEVQAHVICGGWKCTILEIEMLRDLSASEVAVGSRSFEGVRESFSAGKFIQELCEDGFIV